MKRAYRFIALILLLALLMSLFPVAVFASDSDSLVSPTLSASDNSSSHADTCPSRKYTDVNPDPSNWYHPHVDYAVEHGLMNGTSATTFNPNGTITRAMVVTILYRMGGSPTMSGNPGYSDVLPGKWYSNAIKWATDTGIATGYGSGKFGPNDPVTREQMATFLMRYAKFKGKNPSATGSLSGYTDAGQVHSWAVDAVRWAVSIGIIQGTSSTTLNPRGNASRAQFATIAHRYMDKYGQQYVLNTNSKKFHYPGCASVSKMKAKNRLDFTGTRDEVISMGYEPCQICSP